MVMMVRESTMKSRRVKQMLQKEGRTYFDENTKGIKNSGQRSDYQNPLLLLMFEFTTTHAKSEQESVWE